MIRLRQSGVDEILIKRVRDWYDPGLGVFIQSLATASFSPEMLFTGSTTGAWYDPSDFTTLFQDAAGTTPVTAVEQPVGRMLDKSGRGNHAVNNSGNSANFPVLSARYNLLTKTEQFDDAVWVGTSSVTKGTTTGIRPDGTTGTIHTLALPAVNVGGYAFLYQNSGQTLLNIQATFAVYARVASGSATVYTYVEDISTSPAPGNFFASSAHSLTTEWKRLPLTGTRTSVSGATGVIIGFDTRANAAHINASPITIEIWGADLRVANDGVNLPAYQRVNTSSDYDTVGFKQGEVFDGINDYLTASAGGGSTTSFFWCSAIRAGKVGAVQTLFSDAGTNTGYRVRINASNQLELSAGNGTAYSTVSTTETLSIGQRAVLTAWHDGTNLNVQINNGTVYQVAFSTATAGTAQCTIGKDNNAASNFFSGWLYEKVYTKDNVPSSTQIADTKAYVANIAGITP